MLNKTNKVKTNKVNNNKLNKVMFNINKCTLKVSSVHYDAALHHVNLHYQLSTLILYRNLLEWYLNY